MSQSDRETNPEFPTAASFLISDQERRSFLVRKIQKNCYCQRLTERSDDHAGVCAR